ncbi:unnamed protein product [Prorocentrum cordatum]|uniref:Uncharacterized protein n=1 Tax=Prorocentrum cordatum TaxID=2364126 RepID=A0ABN9YJ68_9DINO|nr:unnamed protein product [Polarella glacialis]
MIYTERAQNEETVITSSVESAVSGSPCKQSRREGGGEGRRTGIRERNLRLGQDEEQEEEEPPSPLTGSPETPQQNRARLTAVGEETGVRQQALEQESNVRARARCCEKLERTGQERVTAGEADFGVVATRQQPRSAGTARRGSFGAFEASRRRAADTWPGAGLLRLHQRWRGVPRGSTRRVAGQQLVSLPFLPQWLPQGHHSVPQPPDVSRPLAPRHGLAPKLELVVHFRRFLLRPALLKPHATALLNGRPRPRGATLCRLGSRPGRLLPARPTASSPPAVW